MKYQIVSLLALTTSISSPLAAQQETTEPVVVTATRFTTNINTAPVNVSVITEDEIKQSNITSIGEALESLGGIHTSNLFGGVGLKTGIDMGGFGASRSHNNLVLINGRRLNDVDLAGVNLAAIPISSVEKIEIVHGTSTVLYGDNAVSGVINIVTKSGQTTSGTNAHFKVGSFNTQELAIDSTAKFGKGALFFSAEGKKTKGYRDNSEVEDATFYADYSRQYGKGVYGVRLNVSDETLELPGALNEIAYKADPTQSTFSIEFADEHRKTLEAYIDNGNFAAELAYRDKQQNSLVFGSANADLNTLSFTPRYNTQFGDHNIVVGVDIYKSELDTLSDFSGFGSLNESNTTRDSLAVYLIDTYTLSKQTSVHFGARKQEVEFELINTDLLASTVTRSDQSDSLTAWDVAVNHTLSDQQSFHIRAAKSFRFPVLDEIWSYFGGFVSLLEPQEGEHIELGTRYAISKNNELTVDIFQIDLENEISYVDALFSNVNLDDTRHQGINIKLKSVITPYWNLNTHYSYRNAEFTAGSFSGKNIPEVPTHKLVLHNRFDLGNQRTISFDAIHTGERYFGDDFDNAFKKMPAHTVYNLSYKKAYKDWSLGVKVDNLFNKKYSEVGYYTSWATPPYAYYPLPERAFYVTFEGRI